ncbi:hypothetical protein EV702DRAFT_1040578 [Suillus placidus]|uniref:Uncharacterized protein n=1 Tax=Suillus placidus TaxID=48579 RepID=A0A9P7A9Z2_9AGAM|nr:hypothetical protein EV702DRAFT_1040578 [Suillus placidus]
MYLTPLSVLFHPLYSLERWSILPLYHYATSLTDLPTSVVIEVARQLPSAFVPKKRTRPESVKFLLSHFSCLCAKLGAAPDKVLFSRYLSFIKHPLPSVSRLCIISAYIEMLYGEAVATALRRPYNYLVADPDHISNLDSEPHLSWALLPAKVLVQHLEKLDRADIVKCIGNLPRSRRPGYAHKSRRQCCTALVQHIQQRISCLQSLGDYMFLVNVLSVVPFAVPGTHEYLMSLVLHHEYSTLLVNHLEQPVVPLPERHKQDRRVVPHEVVMDCLRDYVVGSCWQPSVVPMTGAAKGLFTKPATKAAEGKGKHKADGPAGQASPAKKGAGQSKAA